MRSTVVLAGICTAVFASAGDAIADVELSTSVEPMVVNYPQQRVLTYRLVMRTGEQQERLSVAARNLPVSGGHSTTLEGPGTLGLGLHGDPGFPEHCPRLRVLPSIQQFYTVLLPPHSTSVLVSRSTLLRAPYAARDLRVSYEFSSFSPVSTEPITFEGSSGVRSPQPVLAGVQGVRIKLAIRPQATLAAPAAIRLGESVLIRGRTSPQLTGQVIVLRAARGPRGSGEFASRTVKLTVARARVAADGSFQTRWHPPSRAHWGVYALYRSQDPRRSDGSTPCDLPIQVR